MDIFFKPEPYDISPSRVKTLLSVNSQDIYFAYPFNLTRKTNSAEKWLRQAPQVFIQLMLISMLCLAVIVSLDAWFVGIFRNKNRTMAQRLDLIVLRLLYVGFSFFGIFSPSSFRITYRFLLITVVMLGMYRLVNIIFLSVVQTSLIILDLSDVHDNLRDVMRSGRQPFLVKDEKYLNYFKNSKPSTVFGQTWKAVVQNSAWLIQHPKMYKKYDQVRKGVVVSDYIFM